MTAVAHGRASLVVPGKPTGTTGWRSTVAAAAAEFAIGSGFSADFVLRPGRWVDLDTLTESTARGLQDAGALAPRYAGLDAVVSTKRYGPQPGVTITAAAGDLTGRPPGRVALEVDHSVVPRAGDRAAKRAWRERIGEAWRDASPLQEPSWADVELGVSGSLLGPLEVVLDALEPVLGRDPRARAWQEFFPNDDRIVWLRVRRRRESPVLRLRMGPLRK